MRADALFFVGLLAFLFVAWVATGGPQKPISFSGPFITPITNVNQEQSAYGSFWDIDPRETNWWTGDFGNGSWSWGGGSSSQEELWQTQDKLEDLQRDLQEARMWGDPSPYRGDVKITKSASSLASGDGDEEYLIVTVSGSADAPITVTGWKLAATRSRAYGFIPQGVELYTLGSVHTSHPITLNPGDRAVIVSGRSPVGVSFKENICSGYLERRQDFYPALSQSCPRPSDDFDRFYDGSASDIKSVKMRSAQ